MVIRLLVSVLLALGLGLLSACAAESSTERQAREAAELQVNFGEDPSYQPGVLMSAAERESVARQEVETIEGNLRAMEAQYGVNLSDESSAKAEAFDWSKLSQAQREDLRVRLNTVVIASQSSEGLRKNAQAWLASLKAADGLSVVQGHTAGLDILKEAQSLNADYGFNLLNPTDVAGYATREIIENDPNPFEPEVKRYDWSVYNPEELARLKARLEEFVVKTSEEIRNAQAVNDLKLASDYQALRKGARFYLQSLAVFESKGAGSGHNP